MKSNKELQIKMTEGKNTPLQYCYYIFSLFLPVDEEVENTHNISSNVNT